MGGGIDLAQISAIITAVGGLVLTVMTGLAQRQRRSALNAAQVQTELEGRTEQYGASTMHVSVLEETLRERGLPVPARPVEMSAKWWAKRIGADKADEGDAK